MKRLVLVFLYHNFFFKYLLFINYEKQEQKFYYSFFNQINCYFTFTRILYLIS